MSVEAVDEYLDRADRNMASWRAMDSDDPDVFPFVLSAMIYTLGANAESQVLAARATRRHALALEESNALQREALLLAAERLAFEREQYEAQREGAAVLRALSVEPAAA